ncbi:unnamed protein product [Ceutorhynchus assimilis]|uniref:Cellulase n=1 Tax=Ceutorhynchus assimilis TaxID=467358 RepID=A0A9N9MBD8_9CUCU|nr:unnamed protein product [Ceutorhynchus assimilis]
MLNITVSLLLSGLLLSDIRPIPSVDTEDQTQVQFNGFAKTTRYWDCCKPSCSWSANVHESKPVDSCQMNGVRRINNQAQSGCNGGPAFTCNNQQPWKVNNNLAYGFVAGSFKGGVDNSRCCTCYKLKFRNPRGKVMIVQVINTGGDLGHNHFDIQIPGGGVGVFNQGCHKQWNAPWDGWGKRYGGVGLERECDQLPWQLRDGCKFRWRFLQGADNPDVDFEQVGCPNELVSRTNCKK